MKFRLDPQGLQALILPCCGFDSVSMRRALNEGTLRTHCAACGAPWGVRLAGGDTYIVTSDRDSRHPVDHYAVVEDVRRDPPEGLDEFLLRQLPPRRAFGGHESDRSSRETLFLAGAIQPTGMGLWEWTEAGMIWLARKAVEEGA